MSAGDKSSVQLVSSTGWSRPGRRCCALDGGDVYLGVVVYSQSFFQRCDRSCVDAGWLGQYCLCAGVISAVQALNKSKENGSCQNLVPFTRMQNSRRDLRQQHTVHLQYILMLDTASQKPRC